MRQGSFAEGELERYRKRTRRERFLQEMDRVVPLGGVVQSSLAVLSEGERGASTGWSGADASDSLSPALVQFVGPGGRIGTVLFG